MRRDQIEQARKNGPKITRKLTHSVSRVGEEIGRVYRQVRRGEIDPADGVRFAQMLGQLKSCIETAELERRLDEREAAVVRGTPTAPWKPKIVS